MAKEHRGKVVSRRQFMQISALSGLGIAVAACASSAPAPAPAQEGGGAAEQAAAPAESVAAVPSKYNEAPMLAELETNR